MCVEIAAADEMTNGQTNAKTAGIDSETPRFWGER